MNYLQAENAFFQKKDLVKLHTIYIKTVLRLFVNACDSPKILLQALLKWLLLAYARF